MAQNTSFLNPLLLWNWQRRQSMRRTAGHINVKKMKTVQTKIFYRCKKVSQRNPIQCSTSALLILKSENQEVEIHKILCAHDHKPRIFSVS